MNEGLFDMRSRAGRDAEVLAELQLQPLGLPVAWIAANRNRHAAIERLIVRGVVHRLPMKHPSVQRFGMGKVKAKGVIKRLGRWLS